LITDVEQWKQEEKDIYVRHISWEPGMWKIETLAGGLSYIKMEAAYGGGELNQFRRMSSCGFCTSGYETPGTARSRLVDLVLRTRLSCRNPYRPVFIMKT
jgi:hypothetical protein